MITTDDQGRRPRGRTSAPAVVGTIVVIAAAVLLGVVGPRLADRGVAPAGVPVSSVIESLSARHAGLAPDPDPSRLPSDWRRRIAEETHREVMLRDDLAAEGWTLVAFRAEPPRPFADLPIAATALLEPPDGGPLLSVTAIRDDGSIHRLDGFARPRPLREGERLRLDGSQTIHGTAVLAVVEGDLLWILLCEDAARLDAVEDELLGPPPTTGDAADSPA